MHTKVYRENGVTTMSFIRLINTGDSSQDLALDIPRFFIYGFNGAADVGAGTISYHSSGTPVVSNDRVILGTTAECSGMLVFFYWVFFKFH